MKYAWHKNVQTKTNSLRNNNPMFDGNLLLNFYVQLSIYDVRKFFTIINPPILALILNILFLEKYTFTWGEASLVFLLYPSIQESSKNAQNSHSWANLKHCPRMSVGKATIRPEHIWLKSMPYWWIWWKKFENITRVLEDSIVKVVWTCISAS